jgi:hypothetical protein
MSVRTVKGRIKRKSPRVGYLSRRVPTGSWMFSEGDPSDIMPDGGGEVVPLVRESELTEMERLRQGYLQERKYLLKMQSRDARRLFALHASLAAFVDEREEAMTLLAPACKEETLCGAIRNLQQSNMTNREFAEKAELKMAAMEAILRDAAVGACVCGDGSCVTCRADRLLNPESYTEDEGG